MICVEIGPEGYIVANGFPVEECTDYLLIPVTKMPAMTYWADLAIALDPSEFAFWAVMGAMLGMHAAFYGLKAIRDLLRRPNH